MPFTPRPTPRGALRVGFVCGALVLVAASLWWAGVQWATLAGDAPTPALPARVGHAVLMTFGFFPLFFSGFLFSVGSKWLRQPPVPARRAVPLLVLHTAGALAVGAALLVPDTAHAAMLLSAGLGLMALSLSAGMAVLARRVCAAAAADRHPALGLLATGLLGVAALWACTVPAAAGEWTRLLDTCRAALWAYVGGTFVMAGQRMVAFLSQLPMTRGAEGGAGRWIPRLQRVLPRLMLLALLAQALAALGLVPPVVATTIGMAVGLLLLGLAARWPCVQSLRSPLLGMLFAGFVWLALALLLCGLPQVALHALALGFMGSTMLALLSRFVAAEGGIPVAADAALRRLFVGVQIAAAARLLAALLPQRPFASQALLVAAATLWALVWLAWSVRVRHPFGRHRR